MHQTIFFWTLLVRKIVHSFETDPDSRPNLVPLPQHLKDKLGSAPLSSITADESIYEFSAEQQEQIKDMFQIFDSDCSGTIESHELGPALLALGFHSKQANNAGSMLQVSGSQRWKQLPQTDQYEGQVTLEQFSALMRSGYDQRDPLDDVWAAFRWVHQLSHQNQESIQGNDPWEPLSREKVRHACEVFELNLGEEELDRMMRGSGGSRTVDFGLFVQIMCRSPWF